MHRKCGIPKIWYKLNNKIVLIKNYCIISFFIIFQRNFKNEIFFNNHRGYEWILLHFSCSLRVILYCYNTMTIVREFSVCAAVYQFKYYIKRTL